MPLAPRHCWHLLAISIIFLTYWYILPFPRLKNNNGPVHAASTSWHSNWYAPREAARNSTLGFQSILTLSTGPSWRTRGLLAAAQLTGLTIQIPPHPPENREIIDAFRDFGSPEAQHPSRGAAAAWLAHLDLVKFVIQSDYDTALIIEDDVDWDVSIKNQMMLISDAIRNLTKAPGEDHTPYGRDWDILWIGHCGEYWEERYETIIFEDPAVCPHDKYFGWAQQYISRLPDYRRAVYRSFNPVCSFAYAVSRPGARKLLEYTGSGKGEAFDVKMMEGCKTRVLNCISVVPEVIHQYFPDESFSVKSEVDIRNGEQEEPIDDRFEGVMGSTENILESARCHALWNRSCLRPTKPDPV